MPGRKPLLESELPLVQAVLPEFSVRDQALVSLGLNTGFRISELLSLDVADVWDGERVRPQVKVTRAKMKGGHGVRRKAVTSRTVPLNEAATQALQRYVFARMGAGEVQPKEPLFPSRFHGLRLTRWGANQVVHRRQWRLWHPHAAQDLLPANLQEDQSRPEPDACRHGAIQLRDDPEIPARGRVGNHAGHHGHLGTDARRQRTVRGGGPRLG
jgi:integrase